MADRETRRLSFGSVATDYDRYRPSPPPQALDWLIPSGARAVLDLAAGTGAVTRELIGRAARVIAVEPDERMRVGGILGVLWIARDMREPWVTEFNQLAREAREADRGPAGRRRREVTFAPGTPMSPVEERTVEFSLPMTKDELVGLLGTYSGVITLDAERRADFTRRVRAFLDRQPWDRTDLPLICRCLRSRRLAG